MGIDDWGGIGDYIDDYLNSSSSSEDAGAVQLPPPNTVELDWQRRRLQKLPNDFGQLTALQKLNLSRASACAEWRCCCGLRTIELGER